MEKLKTDTFVFISDGRLEALVSGLTLKELPLYINDRYDYVRWAVRAKLSGEDFSLHRFYACDLMRGPTGL